jgi:hypothetical protein
MLNILGIITSVLSKITDSFNRSDGSIGSTDTGQTWSATRGTWTISTNKATSSDAGSAYPLASINLGLQDVAVSADITNGGPGVAFWVTDNNNWWASSVSYSSSSCNCQTCGGDCASYNPTYCAQANYCQYSYISGYTNGSCNGCNACGASYYSGGAPDCRCYDNNDGDVGSSGCATYVQIPVYTVVSEYNEAQCGCATYGGGGCASYNPTYSCNCQTCTATTLSIYSDVSGTITTPTSSTIATQSNSSSYTTASSILVSTSGDVITAKAYSSAGLSSQLGSDLVYTATSPTKGTSVGIVKTPSTTNAGSLLDNFAAQ